MNSVPSGASRVPIVCPKSTWGAATTDPALSRYLKPLLEVTSSPAPVADGVAAGAVADGDTDAEPGPALEELLPPPQPAATVASATAAIEEVMPALRFMLPPISKVHRR